VSGALVIAIVGAESTGKTTLAPALAARLAELSGLRCGWVGEQLRGWCERMGRTPLQHEQASIARAQAEAIDDAARVQEVVVCDTTPLMTAVYSRLLFDDPSLEPFALEWHRRCAHTLLTALDIDWVADGHQRDGPHVREPVDRMLRELLTAQQLPWSPVGGQGQARVERAVDAVAPLLRVAGPRADGLFTRLAARNAEPSSRPWSCELCDEPDCEHRLRR
jgi:nicotinamide riboside kinase